MSTSTPTTDIEELVSRLKQRDESALAEFLGLYKRLLYTVALKILKNESEVEDVVSIVLMKVWNNIDSYDLSKGGFESWITRITTYTALDRLRHLCRRHQLDTKYSEMVNRELRERKVLVSLDLSHDANIILALFDNEIISPLQSDCLKWHIIEGLTHEEIATNKRMPLGTVKARIKSGQKKLRRLLQQKLGITRN